MVVEMKTPPDNPEFAKFTNAMRDVLKVSKEELNRRMEAERLSKSSASRDSGASSKKAHQN
jgi:hypothetical protein